MRSTRKPLPVSIPRKGGRRRQLPDDDARDARPTAAPTSLLTYVTEAPAWKPSYRVVVGDKGKVMLEGWAIVDNTSGEDWKGVLVGVGARSALSFRYDLWSVRRIERDMLAGEEQFAVAPPTGVSPYDEAGAARSSSQLDANEVRSDRRGRAAARRSRPRTAMPSMAPTRPA